MKIHFSISDPKTKEIDVEDGTYFAMIFDPNTEKSDYFKIKIDGLRARVAKLFAEDGSIRFSVEDHRYSVPYQVERIFANDMNCHRLEKSEWEEYSRQASKHMDLFSSWLME